MGLAFDNLTCEELCDLICGKPDDDNVSVMIFSCDAYSDIWKYFLRLYYKYWDCPYETYITAETKQVVGDVSIINTTGSWTDRMREALERIPTEYVITMCEDCFIRKTVRQDVIDQCVEYLEANPNIACFNFEKDYFGQSVPSQYKGFGLKVEGHCWQKSCQPTLWRKSILIELLQGSMSAWEWEESNAPYNYQYYVWNGSPEDLVFEYGYHNNKWFGIRKGKWVKDDVVPLFEKEHIDVDFSVRGFYEENN